MKKQLLFGFLITLATLSYSIDDHNHTLPTQTSQNYLNIIETLQDNLVLKKTSFDLLKKIHTEKHTLSALFQELALAIPEIFSHEEITTYQTILHEPLLQSSFQHAVCDIGDEVCLLSLFMWDLHQECIQLKNDAIVLFWFEMLLVQTRGLQIPDHNVHTSTYQLLTQSNGYQDFLNSYQQKFQNSYISLHDSLQNPALTSIGSHQQPIKNSIKTVLIVCGIGMTGGPENLCQISYELKKLGFPVYFLWRTKNFHIIKKQYINGTWYICGQELEQAPLVYQAEYDVKGLDFNLELNESTLVIIPEIHIDFLNFFGEARKMIAWLSIGFLHVDHTSETSRWLIAQKKLHFMDCIHTAQAPWIEKQLTAWGAAPYLLGDYIAKRYFVAPQTSPQKNTIAYNPKKGAQLSQSFTSKYRHHKYRRLEKLDSAGMLQALDSSLIYIDFGDFPGKDRIPREALMRDCVVFIHNAGCATDYDSFPMDNYFRFSAKDVTNGVLEKKVQEVLNNYEEMYEKQSFIRNCIRQEFDEFTQRLQNLFGYPNQG